MEEASEGTAQATIPQGTDTSVLPPNFKSVDALVNSYNELQRSFTQASQKASQFEKVQNFDWNGLAANYFETGEVDQKQVNQLVKAGYSQDFINTYLQGQSALMEQKANKLYEKVGGKESYEELLTWAGENLDDASIEAFNQSLMQGEAAANLALQGLYSQFLNSNNLQNEPNSLNNLPNSPVGQAGRFNSTDEMVRAINDKRYQTDDAYRAMVQSKIAKSNL